MNGTPKTLAPKPVKAVSSKRELLVTYGLERIGTVPHSSYTPKCGNKRNSEFLSMKNCNEFEGRLSVDNIDNEFKNDIDDMSSRSEILSILRNESTLYDSSKGFGSECYKDDFYTNTDNNDFFNDNEFLVIDDIRPHLSPFFQVMQPSRSQNPFYKNMSQDQNVEGVDNNDQYFENCDPK